MRHDNVSESAVKGLVNGEESDAPNKLLKLQTVQREQSAIIFYSCLRVMASRGSALACIGQVSSMQHK